MSQTQTVNPVDGQELGRGMKVWRRLCAVLLLAALIASAAWTISHSLADDDLESSPFQTIAAGESRTKNAVPVDFVDLEGRAFDCDAFVDFRGLGTADRERLEALMTSREWRGYGQRIYDAAISHVASRHDFRSRMGDQLSHDIWAATSHAVHGISNNGASAGPVFSGISFACTLPDGSQDEREEALWPAMA